MGLIRKAYGNLIVAKTLIGQRSVPYMSAERLCSLRDARVRDAVTYAAETVPFYREFFRSEKIDPREIRTGEDLARLPLITQEDVRANPLRFVSTSRRAKDSILFHTSGSTGIPLDIYHDRKSLLENIAYGEREQAVISKLLGRSNKPREAFIRYPNNTLQRVKTLYREMTFFPLRPENSHVSIYDSIEENIKALNEFKPNIIRSYGSYIDLLFREARSRGLSLYLPDLFLYSSDNMSEEIKKLIEDEYGVPVLARYNSMESFKIGFTCEERAGFHIHDDICHLRILNDAGGPVALGKTGQVVISNLVNRATVLLNYAIEDIASLATKPCPCGRTLPLLENLEGRIDDFLTRPDGELIHPRLIWKAFVGKREVIQYRFIQRLPDGFELKIATVDKESYDRIIDSVLAELRAVLGNDAKIEYGYASRIERAESGKFRPVMSLIGKRIK